MHFAIFQEDFLMKLYGNFWVERKKETENEVLKTSSQNKFRKDKMTIYSSSSPLILLLDVKKSTEIWTFFLQKYAGQRFLVAEQDYNLFVQD